MHAGRPSRRYRLLAAFAGIPFGDHVVWGDRVIDLQAAKIDAALLYIFAMLSLVV